MSPSTAGATLRAAPADRGREHRIRNAGSKDMEDVRLGKTGLKVSRLCLGCMTYGTPEKGSHTWALNRALARGGVFYTSATRYEKRSESFSTPLSS
jgi:hypothetical protein